MGPSQLANPHSQTGCGNDSNMANQPSKSRVNKAHRNTTAARYNIKVMRSLEKRLFNDPEADITIGMSKYSQRLQSFKDQVPTNSQAAPSLPNNDVRRRLNENDPVTMIFPLSSEVEDLCRDYQSIAEAMIGLLGSGEVMYESAWAASVMVFRISENIVVKAGHESFSITEHQTLAFLEKHMPEFPAPRPHGLLRLGLRCFLFTSHIPGMNLEKAWPGLDCSQKQDISCQVDILLAKLRSLPFPENASLGDVVGGTCRDVRLSQRVSTKPIMSVTEFEDFIFHGSNTTSPLYVQLLRNLMPSSAKIVLTHGDIRPANIMVRRDDKKWRVTAIIDWETGGFYPEYWEAVKATNMLTPGDHFDWYKYIPQSISPSQYAVPWLVDRLWDRTTTNG
ncbi:kinase-like domain [Cordyceps militaris]|uniref:Kinase-like domain n=1 Tax=Cordyceps militaris TaxID=73501 RepID=A0A2H4SAG0_CORMI|nr:kinase-like domain [Cordyceps militaris]